MSSGVRDHQTHLNAPHDQLLPEHEQLDQTVTGQPKHVVEVDVLENLSSS